MIMTVPATPITLRGVNGLGIGETEQFLLQTLVSGAASFGGGFFGARVGAGAASGGQTPALQTLASAGPSPAPSPTPTPTPTATARAAAKTGRKRLTTGQTAALAVGAVALVGGAAFLFMRAG